MLQDQFGDFVCHTQSKETKVATGRQKPTLMKYTPLAVPVHTCFVLSLAQYLGEFLPQKPALPLVALVSQPAHCPIEATNRSPPVFVRASRAETALDGPAMPCGAVAPNELTMLAGKLIRPGNL